MSERAHCPHCDHGWLGQKGWGGDHECVNGIAIDIDVFHEGWQPDFCYPPAPCHPAFCKSCGGTGDVGEWQGHVLVSEECSACAGSGYLGRNDCQERLADAAGDAA